ncbi:MAG TPA: hypothetical protein VIV15_01860, partial [Anaerolineales bacterium]
VQPESGLGWPGYRTRKGRTGWDPVDADNEAAHMSGTVLQRLFYGRIQHPISLFLAGLLGAVMAAPLVLALLDLVGGNPITRLDSWLVLLLIGIAGIAILVNVLRNLIAKIVR